MTRIPPRAALLALLAAVAGCDDGGDPAPPPVTSPSPPVEPEPAAAGSYEDALRRARALAAKARASREAAAGEEAARAFAAAAALRPGDGEPVLEAALLALDLGDGAAAARHLAALSESAPASGPCRFLRGSILLARGEHVDAALEFRGSVAAGFRVRASEDRIFEATLGHGLALVDQLRFEEAIETLKAASAMRPDHPLMSRGTYAMALAYRRLREPAEAERILRGSIERFATFAPAYAELGDLLAAVGRPDEAAAMLDRAVKVDPSYAQGWLLKAASHGARGEAAAAEAAFAEYARRFPATGESEFRVGEFLQRRGEPEKALKRLQRALELDPSRVRAHYFISLCFRDLGWEEEADAAMDRWRKAEEALRSSHGNRPGGARRSPDAPDHGDAEEPSGGGQAPR